MDSLVLARISLLAIDLNSLKITSDHRLALDCCAISEEKIRSAAQEQFLPLVLMNFAIAEWVNGNKISAWEYLQSAQQIAERGPMQLHLADVHLHRARLFSDPDELAKARALVEKHEYWRRRDELGDAEAAAEYWAINSAGSNGAPPNQSD